MNLYFTSEIRDCLDLFGTPMALKTCCSYICNNGLQFQMEIRKISRRRQHFVDTADFGHFTLLFCRARGRQRNVQRFLRHVHSYCSTHETFCLMTFSLPSSPWSVNLSSIPNIQTWERYHQMDCRYIQICKSDIYRSDMIRNNQGDLIYQAWILINWFSAARSNNIVSML